MSVTNIYYEMGPLRILTDGYITSLPQSAFFGGGNGFASTPAAHRPYHWDHSFDTATWSHLTGARIVGSQTTCFQAMAAGSTRCPTRAESCGEEGSGVLNRSLGTAVKPGGITSERLDGKAVIHNYGHGEAGMSMSWGTGALGADLGMAHRERRVAVIGCGVVGLTTARQLQRRGFDVTIYAMAVRRTALIRTPSGR
jgi:hypothetical protein